MVFQTKEQAIDALEATRSEWLFAARAVARTIGSTGMALTVNDLRKVVPSPPDSVDPRVWGAVFNKKEWEFLGYVKSTRKISHGRSVAQFKWRGAA